MNREHPAADDSVLVQASASGSSGLREPQKRKRVACKECRQAKLRCDGLHGGLGTCTRCSRLALNCEVDTTYRRVNKRLKINEIAEELEYLRSLVGDRSTGDLPLSSSRGPRAATARRNNAEPLLTPTSAARYSHTDDVEVSQQYREAIPLPAPQVQAWEANGADLPPSMENQDSLAAISSSRSLESIKLSGPQVNDLFEAFFNNYHHFLEILDPSAAPDAYYERSPVLFWTIISVAARRYDYDHALLERLGPPVTRLIWSAASRPPLSPSTIQALLLLSTWPFPFDTLWKDPSLLMISMARSAAMQSGLHRPESMQDYLRVKTQLDPEDFRASVKLWAGCYVTAQSVTTCAGQLSLFSSDWVIDRACEAGNKYTVPANLRYHLLIQRFLGRVDKAMAKRARSPTGQPNLMDSDSLMTLLECNFEDLEAEIGNDSEGPHRIALAMAAMVFRTYYFFESSASETRKQGLLRAYSSALNFISMIADEDEQNDFVKYVPNVFSQLLNTAAMLVMKIINSSYSRYVDTDRGKRCFNTVLSLLRRAVLEDNDIRGRGAKILSQLWTVHHSRAVRRVQEPNLKVKSRLGASVLHDELWTWREEFGDQGRPSLKPADGGASSIPFLRPKPSISTRRQELAPVNSSLEGLQSHAFNHIVDDETSTLAANFSNLDWIWDVGFPSFLPIEIDTNPSPPEP